MNEEKKNTNFTVPILVFLLAVAAFLAGSFFTKIQYLEKGKTGTAQVVPTPSFVAQAPQEEKTVLGASEIAKIYENPAAVKGKDDAPVTIVEFSDYECPFCKRYVDETYGKIWEKYGDKIRYIFRDYPLTFHRHAQKTAEAARCAGEQEKYWEMHDLLFKNRENWVGKTDISKELTSYAGKIGINVSQFNECLSSGRFTQKVKDDLQLGSSVGVSGTPTFFVNGRKLVGAQPFESFAQIIDEELSE